MFNYKTLMTKQLKSIIDDPQNIGPNGHDYSDDIELVVDEYNDRIKNKTQGPLDNTIKNKLDNEKKSIEIDPARKKVLDKLEKARKFRKIKPDHLKVKAITVTLLPIHIDILQDVGDGNKSKGLTEIIQFYLENEIFT